MAEHVHDNKFDIIVSFNGTEQRLEVNPAQAVKAVLEHAIKAFGITSNVHVLALFFDDSREIIDVTRSVASWGIVAGTKLILRQSTVLAG